MNLIRKFYDTAIDEGGGAEVETAVVDEQPQFSSVAEAMAKMGKKSDENSLVAIPIDKEVKGEEPKVETPVVATTAEVEKPKEDAPETKEVPKEEPVKEEKPPVAEAKAEPLNLEQVLKNEQPDTILKGLGFNDEVVSLVSEMKEADPKVIGIMQAYKNGTLGEYIKELSVDYTKMPAEEVMRHQLRVEYPKATDRQLDVLYKKEIVEKFKLDADLYDEGEVEEGKMLLEAKADKYRDGFVANQQKYLLPEKPQPKEVDNSPTQEDVAKQQIEAYRKELKENPYTKDIIANNKITFGEGEEKFSYPVDSNDLLDVLTDGSKWIETMYDKDGEHFIPKIEHQLLVAAFAQDSKKFLNEYAKHLKSLGAKEVIAPIENASEPDKAKPAQSEPEPTSPAAMMAKHGRKA